MPGGGTSVPSRRRAALARAGEDAAARWYAAAGYELLERNWRSHLGELDLVCRKGRVLVICEVKARSSARFGSPLEAVDARKQHRLRRLAALYLSASGLRDVQVRFDVAAVDGAGGLSVVEAAFA